MTACIAVFDPAPRALDDGDVFLALGRALSSGEGYVNTWRPEKNPANHFPIGYPAIIAAMDPVAPGVVPLKVLNGLFFLGSIVFVLLISDRLGLPRTASTLVGLVYAVCANQLIYTTMVMSEMPYMFFSLAAFYLFLRIDINKSPEKDATFWLMGVALLAAFFVRTIGMALIIATALTLIHRRAWKHLVFMAALVALAMAPGVFLSNGADGGYLQHFMMADHLDLEKGSVDLRGIGERLWNNTQIYIRFIIPESIIPLMQSLRHNYVLGYFIGIGVAVLSLLGIWRIPRHKDIVVFYVVAIVAILLGWPTPFSSDRLFLPLFPILVLGIINASFTTRPAMIGAGLLAFLVGFALCNLTWTGPLYGQQNLIIGAVTIATFFLILAVLLARQDNVLSRSLPLLLAVCLIMANIPEIIRLNSKRDSGPNALPFAFQEIGLWAKSNTSQDAVFASRSPYFLHLVSHRFSIPLYFKEDYFGGDFIPMRDVTPEKVLAEMESHGIDYLVIDRFDDECERKLSPVIKAAPARFQIVTFSSDSLVTIYRFLKSPGFAPKPLT